MHFTNQYILRDTGTWTKQSKSVNGRRPLARDDELLDYSHDSEAEWEEEEEGEDLESDDEEEKEDKENSDDEVSFLFFCFCRSGIYF